MWAKLNGKKTIIGACLFGAAMIIDQVIVGIFQDQYGLIVVSQWTLAASTTLKWFGAFVTAGGVAHKMMKDGARNGPPAP